MEMVRGIMDLYKDLKDFYAKMVQYKKLLREWAHVFIASEAIVEKIQSIRTELQRTYSRLEKGIARYGGKGSISYGIFGREQNVFDVAFDALDILNFADRQDALDRAMKIVNKAIGKLEAEEESWGAEKTDPKKATKKPPKAFIVHGGKSEARNKLCKFLTTLDIKPLIIEEEPKEGRSVNEQVDYYSKQADFAIILGTADDKDLKDGKLYPRRNDYIEIGRFLEKYPDRIIYLLEEGASLPSVISEKIYTRFTQDNMEAAFVSILKEIKAFGVI